MWAVVAAAGNVLGGLLVLSGRRASDRALSALTGFGAGFLLALVVVEMLPVAFDVQGGVLAALIGYALVHLTQHVLTPHFHYGDETHAEAMVSPGVGMWALVGLLPHSFFDGVALGSGFLHSNELGTMIFAGVLLHKIPTGLSLASVMLASGNDRRRVLMAVGAVGLATVVGAILTPALDGLVRYGLGLAAGVTLYVAASNLMPETQRAHGWSAQAGVFAGIGVFLGARWLLGGA